MIWYGVQKKRPGERKSPAGSRGRAPVGSERFASWSQRQQANIDWIDILKCTLMKYSRILLLFSAILEKVKTLKYIRNHYCIVILQSSTKLHCFGCSHISIHHYFSVVAICFMHCYTLTLPLSSALDIRPRRPFGWSFVIIDKILRIQCKAVLFPMLVQPFLGYHITWKTVPQTDDSEWHCSH